MVGTGVQNGHYGEQKQRGAVFTGPGMVCMIPIGMDIHCMKERRGREGGREGGRGGCFIALSGSSGYSSHRRRRGVTLSSSSGPCDKPSPRLLTPRTSERVRFFLMFYVSYYEG